MTFGTHLHNDFTLMNKTNAVQIFSFPSGPFATNAYVVVCTSSKEIAIIDPAPESASAIIRFIENKNLIPKKIILTHSHWDHIADTAILADKFHLPVFIHKEDAPNLITPGSDGLPCWISIPGRTPTEYLQDEAEVMIGKSKWKVIHTPGHSPGSICLYCADTSLLLSGDTLFQGTIGNLSFPTSEPKRMWPSLQKLAKLPQDTQVFPGHGPATTIGQETWLPKAEELFG